MTMSPLDRDSSSRMSCALSDRAPLTFSRKMLLQPAPWSCPNMGVQGFADRWTPVNKSQSCGRIFRPHFARILRTS